MSAEENVSKYFFRQIRTGIFFNKNPVNPVKKCYLPKCLFSDLSENTIARANRAAYPDRYRNRQNQTDFYHIQRRLENHRDIKIARTNRRFSNAA